MTRIDETPPTLEHQIVSELGTIRTIMTFGAGIAILCLIVQFLVAFSIWANLRGPLKQLDEIAHMNQAVITATCDSTFYTPAELQSRTLMQRKRLELVCASRRRLDSLTIDTHDTSRKP
jgi:hypothetical protein